MAQNLNSTVNINVTANTSQAERQIRELGNELERINGISAPQNAFAGQFDDITNGANKASDSISNMFSIEKINDIESFALSFGAANVAINATSNVLNIMKEQFEDTLDLITNISLGVGESLVDGLDIAIDTLGSLIEVTKDAIIELKELAAIGAEIQESYFTVFNYLGDEAGTELIEFTNNLEELYGLNADSLIGGMRGILGMVSNMNTTMEESVRIAQAFTSFGNDLAAFSGYNFEEVVGQLESAINLGSIRVTSPIVRALDMTAEDVEVFRQFNTVEERAQFLLEKGEKVRGTYEKWLQTAGGKVQSFNTSTDILSNSVSKLATGIFAAFAPALTTINNLLDKIINKVYNILQLDITSAEGNIADNISDIANSITEVGSAATDTEKKLAKFDDVIQINDNSSNSKLTGNISAKEWQAILDLWNKTNETNRELSEFEKRIGKVWEAIDSGDWEGAGKEINNLFSSLLTEIPWNKIQTGTVNVSTDIADIINGILDDGTLASQIGKTLAKGLNTAVSFASTFAKELDWSDVGTSLFTSWNSFWKNLDSKELGTGIYNWISGGIEAASTFVNDMWNIGTWIDTDGDEIKDKLVNGWELSGFKIADTINSFFGSFTQEDINNAVDSVIGFLDGVFDGIDAFLQTLDVEDIKKKLKQIITNLVESFGEHAEEWGTTLNELITTILDLIEYAIDTADQSGLTTAITDFLNALDIDQILLKWLGIKAKIWLAQMDIMISQMIQSWSEFMSQAWQNLVDFLGAILLFIGGAIVSIVALIWDGLVDFAEVIVEAGAGIIEGVADIGSSVWNGIKSAFDPKKWIDLGKGAFKGLWEGLSSIWDSIKKWWNKNIAKEWFSIEVPDWVPGWGGESYSIGIPKLAKGGIATRSTIANIGEAGKEAVLPLENNTGWMDDLATKLATKINNGSSISSQNIVVDMSGYVKNVYTRAELLEFAELVVEALKLYGANVSMNY